MAKTSALTFKPATTPFMGTTRGRSPQGAAATVFGAPHGTPYRGIDNRVHQKAPHAFRAALKADAEWVEHWDFDFDGPLRPENARTAVDLGDLKTLATQGASNRKLIERATRACVDAGSVPLMFGGDDSTPIPFLAGFAGGNPVTVLQLDAHIDWRDERLGEKVGFSSTMRRASEMEHVWRIVQVGARGLGSARRAEVEAARQWGAHVYPARMVHEQGVKQVLSQIEQGSDCVISLDLDVLDSAVMPSVAAPSPGGFSYAQLIDIITGVAGKARIAGFSMVEFVPGRDAHGVCAYTAARVALHVLHHVLRQK